MCGCSVKKKNKSNTAIGSPLLRNLVLGKCIAIIRKSFSIIPVERLPFLRFYIKLSELPLFGAPSCGCYSIVKVVIE